MTAALLAALRESERRAEGIRRAWRAIADLEVTAESPDGYVLVGVDGTGGLRRLELDPQIYLGAPAALAGAVTGAMAAAREQARRQVFELVRPLLPPHAQAEDTDLAGDPVLAELARLRRRTR